MSEMLEIILDSTNKIFKDYCTKELLDELEQGQWAKELWDVVVESGLTSVGISEDAGGTGGDATDAFNIVRLAGKYAVPLPLAETIMGQWLLSELGLELTEEPMTLSFDSTNEFEFVETLDGYAVTGKAKNVPWARHAKQLLTGGSFNGQYVVILLPLDEATISEGKNMADEPRDTVTFAEANLQNLSFHFIDKDRIQEKVDKMGALFRSAMIVGSIERVVELCVFYANERQQFGRPLHRFQAIQHHIATLTGEAVASLASLNCAVHAYQNGHGDKEVPLTKMKVSEAAGKVSDIAHQLHGAIGVTHEHILQHLTRRLWSWRDENGNESFWATKLADDLMNTDMSLWEFMTGHRVGHLESEEGELCQI